MNYSSVNIHQLKFMLFFFTQYHHKIYKLSSILIVFYSGKNVRLIHKLILFS